MNSKRKQVPNWIERGEGKVPIGKGSNQPMNFKKRNARKQRPAQNKGRHGITHHAQDNTKHRR